MCMCAHMCAHACGGQKQASDPLELELQGLSTASPKCWDLSSNDDDT